MQPECEMPSWAGTKTVSNKMTDVSQYVHLIENRHIIFRISLVFIIIPEN